MFFFCFPGETQKYFLANYKEAKGRSLVQFWIDSVCDKSVLDLLIPASLDEPRTDNSDEAEPTGGCLTQFSGAIDSSNNVHNLSSDSLENFGDRDNFLCENTCEPTVLRDSQCDSESVDSNKGNRTISGSLENIAETECGGKAPSVDSVAPTSKRDCILRRLEKVSIVEVITY